MLAYHFAQALWAHKISAENGPVAFVLRKLVSEPWADLSDRAVLPSYLSNHALLQAQAAHAHVAFILYSIQPQSPLSSVNMCRKLSHYSPMWSARVWTHQGCSQMAAWPFPLTPLHSSSLRHFFFCCPLLLHTLVLYTHADIVATVSRCDITLL